MLLLLLLSRKQLLSIAVGDVCKTCCVGMEINCNSLAVFLDVCMSGWDGRCFDTVVVRVALAGTAVIEIGMMRNILLLLSQARTHSITTFQGSKIILLQRWSIYECHRIRIPIGSTELRENTAVAAATLDLMLLLRQQLI